MRRMIFILLTVLAVSVFVFNINVGNAGDFAVGATLENFTLPDTGGKALSFNDLKGKNGAVIVFLSAQYLVVR